MDTAFQFIALPYEPFAPLFSQNAAQREAAGAQLIVVDEKPGTPCRVSLADADVGETVLALPFTHHDVRSPYRASGPIFIREGAAMAHPPPNEIPLMFRHRLLSLRAYDADAIMRHADVAQGADLQTVLRDMFRDDAVRYIHVHNARPGCFNSTVVRA